MKGSRTAAMLCVLFGHALLVWGLMRLTAQRPELRGRPVEEFVTEMVIPLGCLDCDADEPPANLPEPRVVARPDAPTLPGDASAEAGAGESAALSQPAYTDWPKEGKDAAARVLAREAEAERIARMFAGPQGTWASLTKREREQFNNFRWKPGIDGLERDANGMVIYRMKNGCTLVAFVFIGCPIGKKPEPYGDMFKDMRKYFDEQRLPQTDVGNGTEPESRRPPRWSKPLPERKPELDVP